VQTVVVYRPCPRHPWRGPWLWTMKPWRQCSGTWSNSCALNLHRARNQNPQKPFEQPCAGTLQCAVAAHTDRDRRDDAGSQCGDTVDCAAGHGATTTRSFCAGWRRPRGSRRRRGKTWSRLHRERKKRTVEQALKESGGRGRADCEDERQARIRRTRPSTRWI
jgi:hypothetical protein